MGFGYGEHACPGRFFASNEMKVALSFLLLNYDWKAGSGPAFIPFELKAVLHPEYEVGFRRREAEKVL